MRPPKCLSRSLPVVFLILACAPSGWSDDGAWVELTGLEAWQPPIEGWSTVGSARLDPGNPKKLAVEPGTGIISNDSNGKARNLISKETFGDVELHLEFNVPKGSNSGVKFQAVYEVQIFDSFGARTLKGSDSGGVYPRSEEKPKYHHIDDGHAPLVNASKPPGEWQTLDLTFLAPRFDPAGKKVASARITAILNGKTVQDNLEVLTPTGAAWKNKEQPTGPILLQADHGPVAFRNIKARHLPSKH
jgi:3-keto-disaccharide hydrolase